MSTANAFAEFISRKVEQFDEEIISSMEPPNSDWLGRIVVGNMKFNNYQEVLDAVRKLSEGLAYLPTLFGPISMCKFHKEDGFEASLDRFEKVFPNYRGTKPD